MFSLIFEIPIVVEAIVFSRIALLDPLAKVSSPPLISNPLISYQRNKVRCRSNLLLFACQQPFASSNLFFTNYYRNHYRNHYRWLDFIPLWEILTISFRFTVIDMIVGDLVPSNQQNEMIRNT